MSRELDNANPTIFAPASSSASRQRSPKALLWDDDLDEYTLVGKEHEEEEREEIDALEVYGAFILWRHQHDLLN